MPGKGPSIFAFSDRDAKEANLREALERDEVEVVFQPQVDAKTGKIIGAEALARWKHPEFGELAAHELFEMAQDADLVPALSRQVAGKALQLAKDWPGDLRLAINVTPAELDNPRFEAIFSRMVNESGFPVERLVVEITEERPLKDLPATAEILRRLRTSGIKIAMDDFGAGYCNFNYLKLLPLDIIKLDRSIIESIDKNPRDFAILRSIMSLAQALELDVVAEGIENEAQRRIATEEGCVYLQGYLFAEPAGMDALLEMASA